jgi:hypothetical protein
MSFFDAAAKLLSTLFTIRIYDLLSFIAVIKSRKQIIEIVRILNYISNSPYYRDREGQFSISPEKVVSLYQEIIKKLNLKFDIIDLTFSNENTD